MRLLASASYSRMQLVISSRRHSHQQQSSARQWTTQDHVRVMTTSGRLHFIRQLLLMQLMMSMAKLSSSSASSTSQSVQREYHSQLIQ